MASANANVCVVNAPPVNDVLGRIADRWTLSVLLILADASAPVRFTVIRRTMPAVSPRMLAHTLRRLEQDGYVMRTAYPTVPPRVDYALTELGRSFLGPLRPLVTWAERHHDEIQQARATYQPPGRQSAL
jgi:DNA-binding HxlR family transcriptional regulator